MTQSFASQKALTLLHRGVQLSDLDGQAVDPILQGIRPQIKHVRLVKKLPKYILGMLTYRTGEENLLVRSK